MTLPPASNHPDHRPEHHAPAQTRTPRVGSAPILSHQTRTRPPAGRPILPTIALLLLCCACPQRAAEPDPASPETTAHTALAPLLPDDPRPATLALHRVLTPAHGGPTEEARRLLTRHVQTTHAADRDHLLRIVDDEQVQRWLRTPDALLLLSHGVWTPVLLRQELAHTADSVESTWQDDRLPGRIMLRHIELDETGCVHVSRTWNGPTGPNTTLRERFTLCPDRGLVEQHMENSAYGVTLSETRTVVEGLR